ncbi:hypothetical protein qu_367 [Acanthamoeba polyphaga mimivirus]|nr:hypothetical protein [Mimivirus reunion]WMV61702.1 hypothetical protein qu_367 [Mimivirus sp.]WMV62679.1 hypothetical protein qu_367 [Acanthamoeba polyphaga mimivirus]WMV63656.1 hypothetical protein qu_367 [Mimivirus sp.]
MTHNFLNHAPGFSYQNQAPQPQYYTRQPPSAGAHYPPNPLTPSQYVGGPSYSAGRPYQSQHAYAQPGCTSCGTGCNTGCNVQANCNIPNFYTDFKPPSFQTTYCPPSVNVGCYNTPQKTYPQTNNYRSAHNPNQFNMGFNTQVPSFNYGGGPCVTYGTPSYSQQQEPQHYYKKHKHHGHHRPKHVKSSRSCKSCN